MNNSATFITDKEKLSLTSTDLFDRIINLKITCIDKTAGSSSAQRVEEFVVRSDYELVTPSGEIPVDGVLYPDRKGKYIIRRCTYKPSIKVQYKMVTDSAATQINVFLSNFFMLTKDGKHLRSFNSKDYAIESVQIVMGYWGQFKDMQPLTVDDYFNIEAHNGADKITIAGDKGIYVRTEKLPPDSVISISGFVADIYGSPMGITNVDDTVKAFSKPVAKSGSDMEKILFDNISKRYANLHYFTDGAGSKIPVKLNVPVSTLSKFKTSLILDGDLMTDVDAETYGVKVWASDKVKEMKVPKLVDSEGNEVDNTIFFENGYTIGQTINKICSSLNVLLNYTFTKTGDLIVYTGEEARNPKELYDMFEKAGMYKDSVFANKAFYDGKLPAVYNISIDALATITCPYFTFLEPFQKIEFASRYALTSLVSYYADYNPSITQFYAISVSCSFATVEDINEMQITAVSQRGDE